MGQITHLLLNRLYTHLKVLTTGDRNQRVSHNDPHNVHEDKRYDQMAVNGVSKAT